MVCGGKTRVEIFFFIFLCRSRACSHLAAVFMLLLDFNDRDAGTLLVRSNVTVFSDLTKD